MQSVNGIVELHSFSSSLGGLVIGGWIDFTWDDPIVPPIVCVETLAGTLTGEGLICLYPREDVKKQGHGFLILVALDQFTQSNMVELRLTTENQIYRLLPIPSLELYTEERVFLHAKHFLQNSPSNDRRARFRKLLDRPHFTGVDTLSGSMWPVHLETDKWYFCPPKGLVVRGWFLDPFRKVARIRLCCEGARQAIEPDEWIRIQRRDVAQGFAAQYGSVDEHCGFIAYAPSIYRMGRSMFFEIEMSDGTVVFRPVKPALMTGLSAIKELLSAFDLRRDALVKAYDETIGPAVELMNEFRLEKGPTISVVPFGKQPERARASIIIPLYGRVDFLEYQLAFFADTLDEDHEIIYVLDDPDRASETEALAASAYARFERPFRLLILGHNVGYAPANNIGLKNATGEAICFLNSDVFPREPEWLEFMLETLTKTRGIGIVGARLVYEDGSLQHDGCLFERLPEFGNWPFPMHPGKGRRIEATEDVVDAEIVTGACMVLSRRLAEEMAGFDEGYVIGDFEDADLCLRITDRGYRCVVDNRAELYHLERQSQNLQVGSWRMNLTLYNAWRFQKRWQTRDF